MAAAASTIGERLKAVRTRSGLSQERFAIVLGYSKRALINWEQGVADPPMAILPKLREMFDIDPGWLVMGQGTTPKSFFKPMDWARLERLERDLKQVCRDIGVDLSTAQHAGLVQAFYDDGPAADETNRKQLRMILRGLMKERE